jgi:GNAT superfamily N-acetyltransferase
MLKVTHAAVRAAGLGDIPRILGEYSEAIRNLPVVDSANLLSRPYSEFKAAVENGLFFVVESEAGSFMAGAGAFDLADPTAKELGMCYVKKEWRGFGLQTLLLNVRVCAATLGQAPQRNLPGGANRNYAALITGVKPANDHSAANTGGLGFEPLLVPPHALFLACGSCRTPPAAGSARICCCDFFYLPDARRADTIENSLGMKDWSRTRNDTQLVVSLKVRHLVDPDFRNALQETVLELRSRDPAGVV